jgi:hypothetical protein
MSPRPRRNLRPDLNRSITRQPHIKRGAGVSSRGAVWRYRCIGKQLLAAPVGSRRFQWVRVCRVLTPGTSSLAAIRRNWKTSRGGGTAVACS